MTLTHAELPSATRARKVVALLKAENESELARLVAEHGGSPMSVPAVSAGLYRELEEVRTLIDELATDRYDVALFMTGSSVHCLFEAARELGQVAALATSLRRLSVVCRGPKASAALRSLGLEQTLKTHEPLTDARLVHALVALAGRCILRFNGDTRDCVAKNLRKQRANLRDVSLSHRRSPADDAAAMDLVRHITERRIDALVVTCEIQFRHLYQVARRLDLARELVQALRKEVVVATITGGCQDVVEAHGLRPHIMPAHPKMLVMALMRFLEKTETPCVLHGT